MKKTTVILAALAAAMFGLHADHTPGHEMGKRPGRGMKGPGMMFEKMDTDKDGKISKQEWQAHHDKMFTDLDADGDGSVTRDEMKAMHEKMMAKHGKMKGREEMEEGEGKEKPKEKKKRKKDKDREDEEKEDK